MDLLRFHKFTIGHAWMSEYGNPEKEADFRNLIRLSPLHNVPGDVDRFPATLLLTGKKRFWGGISLCFGANFSFPL